MKKLRKALELQAVIALAQECPEEFLTIKTEEEMKKIIGDHASITNPSHLNSIRMIKKIKYGIASFQLAKSLLENSDAEGN